MEQDLDRVPVRVQNIAGAGSVPVVLDRMEEGDATGLKPGRESIDVVSLPDDEAEVVERGVRLARVAKPIDAMEGEIVGAARQVDVVGVRPPFDPHVERLDVETLGAGDLRDAKSRVMEAGP